MSRREQALDAALDLLAEGGTRRLTHGAVDTAGGLPAGTTSNHFRTRDALLVGVLEHLRDRELAVAAAFASAAPREHTVDSVVADAEAMLAYLLGPGRQQTLARHAVFLEAAWRPELRPGLLQATQPFWDLLAVRLEALGCRHPQRAARHLLACVDGLLLDQLVRPHDDHDPATALRPLLLGLLADR